MQRRDFLRSAAALAVTAHAPPVLAAEPAQGKVMTVTGSIPAGELGTTLPHEHVLVDFVGADEVSRDRYDRESVIAAVLPHLKRARQAGCQTLVECTPAYLGRDPVLLVQLAHASGLKIVTNTGYYAARDGQHLPEHAYREDASQLAERWLAEWRGGIEGTDVRPGFIKIGVGNGPLAEVESKLVRAAARTHLGSGLTIACHTGGGAAAMEELAILKEEGVAPSAWIWVHAQNERDESLHHQAAQEGGWVEFDGITPDTLDRHVELVENMKQHGLLHRVLLSHDAGWYSVGEPEGGDFRPYTTLFKEFLPALKKAGITDEEIRLLTVENPAEALAIVAGASRL